MKRHHATSKGDIPLTPEEELERDIEEAEYFKRIEKGKVEKANSVSLIELVAAIRDKVDGIPGGAARFEQLKGKNII